MMKSKIYLLALTVFVLLISTSCEKEIESYDDSFITNYVQFELNEGSIVTHPVGTPFTDPGLIAMEGETDVTSDVNIVGEVDADNVGIYTLNYSALNIDGYPASVARTVIVYDPNAPETDLSGEYDGERVGRGGGPVTIENVAPGIFYCSDMFGGFYEVVFAYGSAYRARGYMKINEDNTIDGYNVVSPWGGMELQNAVYDPETGNINHVIYFPMFDFGFDVSLTKK